MWTYANKNLHYSLMVMNLDLIFISLWRESYAILLANSH